VFFSASASTLLASNVIVLVQISSSHATWAAEAAPLSGKTECQQERASQYHPRESAHFGSSGGERQSKRCSASFHSRIAESSQPMQYNTLIAESGSTLSAEKGFDVGHQSR